MKFEEMKTIWDTTNNEMLFGINEQAMHNMIHAKKEVGQHITNTSELLWIVVNIIAGSFVLGINLFKGSENVFMYLMSAWMFGTAFFLLASRVRRIGASKNFDRTMLGDLEHAISVAIYQERFSILGRWNIVPIGTLVALGLWDSSQSIWVLAGVLVFFILTIYASGFEHRIYKGRRKELESLKAKLAMPK
ncbi:hypothetical protein [Pararhodonellum marinum]|uniref:hypothetical protein n=1 Tax=Pararhodonellum marinum TaxID=2755358 RepID=UPI00188E3452|nr:hypothetical protein [Pararhodonellum marinum]